MQIEDIQKGFVTAGVPNALANEILVGYTEVKRRYYLGDHRPTTVEGGRFCEAVTRVVEHELFGSFTPIGKSLPALNSALLTVMWVMPRLERCVVRGAG